MPWNESDIKIRYTYSPRLSCIRNSLGDYGFEKPGSKELA